MLEEEVDVVKEEKRKCVRIPRHFKSESILEVEHLEV